MKQKIGESKLKTRNTGQSPTWGRPAPWVRWGVNSGGEIYLVAKSRGPKSNAAAYAKRALST